MHEIEPLQLFSGNIYMLRYNNAHCDCHGKELHNLSKLFDDRLTD